MALGLAFAGFVGLESCSAFSEEARSYGALSRAIVAAVVTVGVLYGIGTWALTVAAASWPPRTLKARTWRSA